ncbi:ketoacyl-ACP synthase III [Puteibacter caeruleilacunae]|nr:ketoacyl-ACP synthase III [Puteibacter caeruleilacunae]
MSKRIYTVVTGTGSYIPDVQVKNEDFLNHKFYDPATGEPFDKENAEIIQKFQEITNIEERRFAREDQLTSDLAALAGKDAIETAGIDPETLDFIIVAHNFGDIAHGSIQTQTLPCLANKVKGALGIKNAWVHTHDVINGCPSWVQAMIVADAYIRTGEMKKGLVIGADVLSRISDPHDRDKMIFADGAGAVVVEGVESEEPVGILSFSSRSDTGNELEYLKMAPSDNKELGDENCYIDMLGHKIYVYGLTIVPGVVKNSIDKAGLGIEDVNKVLIHQANEKMDEAILNRLFKLYKTKGDVKAVMPMSINKLGNTSAATVPTLWDMVVKQNHEGHEIKSGDNVVLCSVGGSMNVNSIVYRVQ